ncbi:prepilin-type N-terminal cleavage/methylation domain-containing protein [Candidatus Saccharibacteria bacterium]|nr:prepilin-type N-terminal cleavage/methylation domain-containing protein [Candidatus Saccharibacteria bacterium]
MKDKQTTFGFTIIELVVVILIIGILASLSYGGYGRYRRNAENSLKNDAAKALAAGLKTYVGKNNEYPAKNTMTGEFGACLGNGPELEDGLCTNTTWAQVRSDFNAELEKITKLSRFDYETKRLLVDNGDYFEGVVFIHRPSARVDGKYNKFFLEYALEGDNALCGEGVVKRNDANNYVSTNQGYSFRGSGNTRCVIPLFDPDNPEALLP